MSRRVTGIGGAQIECESSLEEIGLDFEVSKDRIRQIEARAVRKLRHPSRARFLASFMEPDNDPWTWCYRRPPRADAQARPYEAPTPSTIEIPPTSCQHKKPRGWCSVCDAGKKLRWRRQQLPRTEEDSISPKVQLQREYRLLLGYKITD